MTIFFVLTFLIIFVAELYLLHLLVIIASKFYDLKLKQIDVANKRIALQDELNKDLMKIYLKKIESDNLKKE